MSTDIVTRNTDNVVVFQGPALILDEIGVHGIGWHSSVLHDHTGTLHTVDALPDGFVEGGWTYDGITFVVNGIGQARLGEIAEDDLKAADKKAKKDAVDGDAIFNVVRVLSASELDAWFLNATKEELDRLTQWSLRRAINEANEQLEE